MSYTIICDECSKLKREALRQCSRHPCTCGTVAHPTFCGAHPDMLKKHTAEASENERFFALLSAAKQVIAAFGEKNVSKSQSMHCLDAAVEAYDGN